MPSLFDDDEKPQAAEQPGVFSVENSELYCNTCFLMSTEGMYYEERKLLLWSCPVGHENKVTIEL